MRLQFHVAGLLLLASLLASLLSALPGTFALKFDLEATYPGSIDHRRCVSQFIAKDTLVSGNVEVGDGTGQRVDVEVGQNDAT
jgi:hypothetical protein